MKNLIVLWYGEIVDIPAGWALCDGNNGTPDLRDCFIVGAGGTYAPNESALTNIALDTGFCAYALCWIMKVP